MQKGGLFQRVYKVVSKIPEGKVTTYGAIAKKLGTKDSRKIGWALARIKIKMFLVTELSIKRGSWLQVMHLEDLTNKKLGFYQTGLSLRAIPLLIWKNVA